MRLHEMLGQPVCMSPSDGIYGTQLCLGDAIIGRSGTFTEFRDLYLNRYFSNQPAFTMEALQRLNMVVKPGFICAAANGVCYPVHVTMCKEIQCALTDGDVEPEQSPQVWAEKGHFVIETGPATTSAVCRMCSDSRGYYPDFQSSAMGPIFAAHLIVIKKKIGEATVERYIHISSVTVILERPRERVGGVGCLHLAMMGILMRPTSELLTTSCLCKLGALLPGQRGEGFCV
ncbi:putative carboxypeptidase [Leptomonas seymouri]|uniref:Putative carboxypeptidase n=1 Tax=Leptomonas seymouri TaxID=5684 RepID=A0A0N0P4S7_LEPSE|nr:putative carboxypeptidase [Leptomonas seymouri]|eukprot:KPI85167.1 putative carboxypeptidase [Leptomonas seymouri]